MKRISWACVRIGLTAVGFTEGDDAVAVGLSDGTVETFALVVAADGIYSKAREMLFGAKAAESTYTGQMSRRVVAPRLADMNVNHFFFGRSNMGGITPCSETEMYAFVLHPEAEPYRVPDNEKVTFLREPMADFGGSMDVVRDGLTEESAIVQRPFKYVLQSGPLHVGHVVLLGDAAHAPTPHLASGAGLAVEDALVLAEELADNFGAQIEAYERRRHDRCEASVGIAQRPLAGAPREIGMRMSAALQKLGEPI